MEPLSLKTRRVYATTFFVLFLIVLPIVGLYASGYRLSGFSLVSTGGIYVTVPTSGVTLSLNGQELERSNIFSKAFFFNNLTPGSYVIQATSDEYYPWSKNLFVESGFVSDVPVPAIAQPLVVRELVVATTTAQIVQASIATSTTRAIEEERFESIVEIFLATTTALVKESAVENNILSLTPIDKAGGVALFIEEGNLLVRWTRNSPPPSFFCTRPSSCSPLFALARSRSEVTSAQFFAGGVLYRMLGSGVYFSEVDIRIPRLTIPVFTAPDAQFKVIDNSLIVRSQEKYYEIIGF